MMRRLLIAILLWVCATPTFAKPAPGGACKFGSIDRVFVRVYGGENVEAGRALVDAWMTALSPTRNARDFGGLTRVATVTLFHDDAFAGALFVRGEGDVLRLWARDDEKAWDWQPCAAGELPADMVYEWIQGDE